MHRLLRTTLLLSFFFLLVEVAHGQTPTTTIQNGNSETRLQLNYDGGLVVPGSFVNDRTENDSIPATGAGTRMMWYPAKAAFRAGRVSNVFDGTQWDAENVGSYSAAFGVDTEASGFAAIAMGDRTIASGFGATAMGFRSFATGDHARAVGFRTTASSDNATAMGFKTTANGARSTAMGNETIAETPSSLSLGNFNSANRSDDGTLVVVGNGDFNGRSDALILDTFGNLEISGTLAESSDRRLKTSIRPLQDETLTKLSRLRPVRYQFKNQKTHPSGEQIGLIAQDVRKEFPALVRGGEGDALSLSYSKFTAVLLKGLQEQRSVVDSLNERVRNLEAQQQDIDRLKARVSRVESGSAGSVLAGVMGVRGDLMIAFLLGSLLVAGLLWQRRRM